jgi:hypothetical protein
MAIENSLQSRILKSFERYRQPSASASTKALGKRLVGELLGETEYVAATLDPAFEVVFMGTSETGDLSTQEMPSADALRAALTASYR